MQDIKDSILSHFYQIGRYMRQMGGHAGVGDLTTYQIQALFFVKKSQPVKMNELAKELRISPGSTSLLADRLVEGGYLLREHDKKDRRNVYLKLSKETQNHLDQMSKKKMEKIGRMLEALSGKDLNELDRILKKLQDFVKDNLNKIGC